MLKKLINDERGFLIVNWVTSDRQSNRKAQNLYWLFGQILGLSLKKDVNGTLLFNVKLRVMKLVKGFAFLKQRLKVLFILTMLSGK